MMFGMPNPQPQVLEEHAVLTERGRALVDMLLQQEKELFDRVNEIRDVHNQKVQALVDPLVEKFQRDAMAVRQEVDEQKLLLFSELAKELGTEFDSDASYMLDRQHYDRTRVAFLQRVETPQQDMSAILGNVIGEGHG